MSNLVYHCGIPGCLVCGPRWRRRRHRDPVADWERTAAAVRRTMERAERQLERRAEQISSPLRRLIEEIGARRDAR